MTTTSTNTPTDPPEPRPRKDLSLEDLRYQLMTQLDAVSPQAVMAEPDPLDAYGCYLEETYTDYAIVCCGPAYYKVPFTLADDGDADGADLVQLAPRVEWQEVEQAWVVKHLAVKSHRALRVLKSTDASVTVGQYGILWDGQDLVGETFTRETDLWLKQFTAPPILYEHGGHPKIKSAIFGMTTSQVPDDIGVFVKGELDRSAEYFNYVMPLIEQGKLGWSSGSSDYLVRMDAKVVKSWPLVEWSMTPTPCEPRTLGIAQVRSLAPHIKGLDALLPADPPSPVAVPPPAATAAHSPPQEPPTMAVDTQVLDQLGAMAEQLKAFQTQMDPISTMLKRFETEPALSNAGFVSATGGTSDKNIKSFADWLMAVRRQDEVRLEKHYKSTKAANAESGGESGGYLVPVEYAQRLAAIAVEDAIVRPRAGMIYPMAHREVEIPMLDQFTAPSGEQSAFLGGVVAGWVEEAAALPETEPKFKLMKLIAHGLGGYTLASNDLRADSAEALDALLTTLFGRAIGWHEDYAFLRGDGVGKPLGFLSWVGAQTVARHVAGHFDLTDAGAMIAKLTATSMKRAVWIMSQTVIPELVTLQSTSFNAWIQQTATSSLQGSLLGLPILYTEKVPPLGTKKDVALIDWGAYVIGDREGIEIAFSEHFRFTNRQGTWRFFCRRDGQPWLKDAITLQDGSTKVSPSVYLTDH